jgi:uncharacterized protein involved in exopolysaccharide biosynthesis
MEKEGAAIKKEQERTLLDYWLVLYLRKKTFFVIVLSAVVAAGALSFLLSPTYEAETIFFVPAKADTLTLLTPSSAEDIKRSPLLPAPNKNQHTAFLGILKSKGLNQQVSQKVNKDLKDLMKDIDFRLSDEYFIELYARDKDPKVAAMIANTYPEVFNDFLDAVSYGPISQKQLAVQKEMANIKKKLNQSEVFLLKFQRTHQSTSIEGELAHLNSEKMGLETELGRIQIENKVNKENIAALKKMLSHEAQVYISSLLVSSNPMVRKLQTELSDMESTQAALKIDLQENHPDVLKLKAQYNEKKKELEAEISKIVSSEGKDPSSFHENLRHQLITTLLESQTLQAKNTGLKDAISSLKKKITSLPGLYYKMDSLNREVAFYRQTLDNLERQSEEIIAQGRRKAQNVVVLTPAAVPEEPAFPRPIINMLVAILLGVVGGGFYCFFIDYIQNVKKPERSWD